MLDQTMRNCRIDCIFGKKTQHPLVGISAISSWYIVGAGLAPALCTPTLFMHIVSLHRMSHLPGTLDRLAYTPHAERIGSCNADRSKIMQRRLCGHGSWSYAMLRCQHILRKG